MATCGPPSVDEPRTEPGNLNIRTEKRDGNAVEGVTCPRDESGSYIDKFRCLTLLFRKLKNLSVAPQNPTEYSVSIYSLFWMSLLWTHCPPRSAMGASSEKSRRSPSRSILATGPRLPWTVANLWTWPQWGRAAKACWELLESPLGSIFLSHISSYFIPQSGEKVKHPSRKESWPQA